MKQFCSFSEAIREGAKLRPQGFVVLFSGARSCAIGAGLEAIHGRTSDDFTAYDVYEMFPYLRTPVTLCATECPRWNEYDHRTLLTLVAHLNDHHQWTREEIADWLESEEEKLGFVTVVEESEAIKPELARTV